MKSTDLIPKRLLYIIIPAYFCLMLGFLMPRVDPLSSPFFDLTGNVALFAYAISESGGKFGIPFIALLMVGLLVSRPGLTGKRRLLEIGTILGVGILTLGGGAQLNEHYIKVALDEPRPNIEYLAIHPDPASAPLNMSADAFYDQFGSKEERSEYLASISNPTGFDGVSMDERIRDHWIEETGYSRPSGHSMTAFLFATFFLGLGLVYAAGWKRYVFYMLVPWAVMVCYSRPILRVHTLVDITLGGAQGILLGILALYIVQTLLKRAPVSVTA